MNLVPCDHENCNTMFQSALDLKIHRYENHHQIKSEADGQLLKRWCDVK